MQTTVQFECIQLLPQRKHPDFNYANIDIELKTLDEFNASKKPDTNIGIRMGKCRVNGLQRNICCLDIDIKRHKEYIHLDRNEKIKLLESRLSAVDVGDFFGSLSLLDIAKSTFSDISLSGGMHIFFWLDSVDVLPPSGSQVTLPTGEVIEIFHSSPDRQICAVGSRVGTSCVNIYGKSENAMTRLPDGLKIYLNKSVEAAKKLWLEKDLKVKHVKINNDLGYYSATVKTLASIISDNSPGDVIAKLNSELEIPINYYDLWRNVAFAIASDCDNDLTSAEAKKIFVDFSLKIPYDSSGNFETAANVIFKAQRLIEKCISRDYYQVGITFGTIEQYLVILSSDRDNKMMHDLEMMRLDKIAEESTAPPEESEILPRAVTSYLNNRSCLGKTFNALLDHFDERSEDGSQHANFFLAIFCLTTAIQYSYCHNLIRKTNGNFSNYTLITGPSSTSKTLVFKKRYLEISEKIIQHGIVSQTAIQSHRGLEVMFSNFHTTPKGKPVSVQNLLLDLVLVQDECLTGNASFYIRNGKGYSAYSQYKTQINELYSSSTYTSTASKEGKTSFLHGVSLSFLGLSVLNDNQVEELDYESGIMQRTFFVTIPAIPIREEYVDIDYSIDHTKINDFVCLAKKLRYAQYEMFDVADESLDDMMEKHMFVCEDDSNFFDYYHDKSTMKACGKDQPIPNYFEKVRAYTRSVGMKYMTYNEYKEINEPVTRRKFTKERETKKGKKETVDEAAISKEIGSRYIDYVATERANVPRRNPLVIVSPRNIDGAVRAYMHRFNNRARQFCEDQEQHVTEFQAMVTHSLFDRIGQHCCMIASALSLLKNAENGIFPDFNYDTYECLDFSILEWVCGFMYEHAKKEMPKLVDAKKEYTTPIEKSARSKIDIFREFLSRHENTPIPIKTLSRNKKYAGIHRQHGMKQKHLPVGVERHLFTLTESGIIPSRKIVLLGEDMKVAADPQKAAYIMYKS